MMALVTGAAGFFGFHLARRFLEHGHAVVGLDGMADCCDVKLKERRLAILSGHSGVVFHREVIEDEGAVSPIFAAHRQEQMAERESAIL